MCGSLSRCCLARAQRKSLSPSGKSGRPRHEGIIRPETDAITSRWNSRNKGRGLVFCTVFGKPLDLNNLVYECFLSLLKRAELPRVRLYDLRHTTASLLLEAGENLKVVSERLGHASITLTADVYAHVSPQLPAHAAEWLEQLVQAG